MRGYLIGSGWKDYQQTGAVCGIALPAGLRQADRLPEPIFTPATKAEIGAPRREHRLRTRRRADRPRRSPSRCATPRSRSTSAPPHYALPRGIIIADTKFEFGVDDDGTPDADRRGADAGFVALLAGRNVSRRARSPPSFDKQYVRDYLETLDWPKRPPAPQLPPDIIARTSEKYAEALRRLTS